MSTPVNYQDASFYYSMQEVKEGLPPAELRRLQDKALASSRRLTPLVCGLILAGLGIAGTATIEGLLRKQVIVLSQGWRIGVLAGTGGAAGWGLVMAGKGYLSNRRRFKQVFNHAFNQEIARSLQVVKSSPGQGFIYFDQGGYSLFQVDQRRDVQHRWYPYHATSLKEKDLQERARGSYKIAVRVDAYKVLPKNLISLERLSASYRIENVVEHLSSKTS